MKLRGRKKLALGNIKQQNLKLVLAIIESATFVNVVNVQ